MRRVGQWVNWLALGVSLGTLLVVWRVASRPSDVQRLDVHHEVTFTLRRIQDVKLKPELPGALEVDPKRLAELERVVSREVGR